MQKLFSMFPHGAPGLALLLLLLFIGLELASDAINAGTGHHLMFVCVLIACALALAGGLMTPVAATLAPIVESFGLGTQLLHASLRAFSPVVIAVALVLLGPGAYSIDARLKGSTGVRCDRSSAYELKGGVERNLTETNSGSTWLMPNAEMLHRMARSSQSKIGYPAFTRSGGRR